MANGSMQRFFGGSPGAVVVKLVFLSILVGAFMAFFDITPRGLIDGTVRFVRGILNRGFAAVEEVFWWLVYGAVIVVPVWLVLRLFGGGR
ncbi:DUF6460 domain-containing protein [Chelatococcus sp. SYSU_G07232]|uniref:DUF6460 domain-containing protein n=1 Tax=Chelatococcus albus TaxID=3047466 RepID=A0ABT7AF67_9HYPH|nr:DUF6460 domain-containing protein [Chelatococcus sp. SYSU_G07232]MDJ1157996.1 DUF6460 domain-containing protein [Chelatococcus sp. SYSU_G07232]